MPVYLFRASDDNRISEEFFFFPHDTKYKIECKDTTIPVQQILRYGKVIQPVILEELGKEMLRPSLNKTAATGIKLDVGTGPLKYQPIVFKLTTY